MYINCLSKNKITFKITIEYVIVQWWFNKVEYIYIYIYIKEKKEEKKERKEGGIL
jgi:hypothetical protein